MKKIIGFIILGLIIMSIGGKIYWSKNKMDFEKFTSGKTLFICSDEKKEHEITKEDLKSLYQLLNKKILFSENLSCGFSEKASIKINKTYTFYFAQDGCSYIYLKEKDKYLKLSEADYKKMINILKNYDFSFPCF